MVTGWVEVPLLAAWRTLLQQHPATLLAPALQQDNLQASMYPYGKDIGASTSPQLAASPPSMSNCSGIWLYIQSLCLFCFSSCCLVSWGVSEMLFHALNSHDSRMLWDRDWKSVRVSRQRQELVCVCYWIKELERQGNITGQRKCVNNLQNPLPQDFETHGLAGLPIRQWSVIAGNKGNSQFSGSGCSRRGTNPPAGQCRALTVESRGTMCRWPSGPS